MNGPHQPIFGREIFEANIVAADGLNQRRMTKRILRVRTATQCRVPYDPAWTDDSDMVGIDGIEKTGAALDPFAFPSDLQDGVVGEVGRSDDRGALFQPESCIGS